MTVSVVIVTWNGRGHLGPCLEALRRQTRPADEIVLVDNASSDGTVAYVREAFPWVRVLALDENRGFAGGNIAGFEAASGEAIVLLNNDTAPTPGWLEALVDEAETHPRTGIVASLLVDWEGRTIDSAGDLCTVSARGLKRASGRPVEGAPPSGPVFSACAGAALYRRALIDEIGFLEDRFFMNAEDTDLAFRAQLAGWEVRYRRDAVVRHRIGASQGQRSASVVRLSARNHVWIWLRCLPASLQRRYVLSFLGHHLATLVFLARHGQSGHYLRGLVDAFRQLAWAREERARIQASRRLPDEELACRLELVGPTLWARLRNALARS